MCFTNMGKVILWSWLRTGWGDPAGWRSGSTCTWPAASSPASLTPGPGDGRAVLREEVPETSNLAVGALQSQRWARTASAQKGTGGQAAGSAELGKPRGRPVFP